MLVGVLVMVLIGVLAPVLDTSSSVMFSRSANQYIVHSKSCGC